MNPNRNNQPPRNNEGQSPYGPYGEQPAVASYQDDQSQQQAQTPQQQPPANQQPGYNPQQPPPPSPQQQVPPPPPNPPKSKPKQVKKKQSDQASNQTSTQNQLNIAEIRDGMVIMNNGSFRSVVMVKSINFDLMSPEEKNAIEYAYQGFLNSLYFPVQIYIHSTRVDIRRYLSQLDKIRQQHANMLLALLMEDYIAYMSNLAAQTNIMDKKFYIVVPYFTSTSPQEALSHSKNFFTGLTDLFKNQEVHVVINEKELTRAKDELTKRVSHVLNGLRECNIPALPLDTQELIELYYDTYNPDTATRQQLKNFEDMNTPVVKRGEYSGDNPAENKGNSQW